MALTTAIRAPRGRAMTCKGWHQEAALRMLHNNLDPEVAEKPDELIVYGGTGRAARSWEAFHAIVRALESLENDESLLVQSGRPVGIFRTHPEAPRVLIANANLVGHWSNWDEFNRLERLGLTMYGQMTAGSWIYIGSQGIVQGTYETFAAMARQHFGGSLAGKLVVSGGMGGMGGAQPLAATMNGACFLGIEVDPQRIERRLATGYCDRMARSLEEALRTLSEARARGEAISVGLVGNCADVVPELARRGIVPDALTDQTSAHDPLNGYVPNGVTLEEARRLRAADPAEYVKRSMHAMAVHVEAMLALREKGAVTFDYGNNLRAQARQAGVERAFDIPGFVPEYIRPLFCEGRGPFRWVALSGDAEDIYRTDRLARELFPDDETLARWLPLARDAHPVPGAAGAHLLAGLWRARGIRRGHQPAGAVGRIEGAHRDWPRPSGYGLGGLALPRNRGHAGRLGRHRRLAAAQRAGEHRGRRVVGFHSQRRRRGHRLLAACRDGGGGGRNRGKRAPPGTRAHHRPRHGRHPPRRCRLRRGRALRARARNSETDGGVKAHRGGAEERSTRRKLHADSAPPRLRDEI